jgi:uncharacterized protein YfaS (alpha-2-macroglobulin family)
MFLKKILLTLFAAASIVTTMAQTRDYKNNWKKVEDFEKKGLTRSAKEEVMIIYELAVKEKQDAQQIKAAMFLIKYRNMVEEDSRENNIFYVDTLIAKAVSPAKNILQSMHAEMFWQYLQNNRWKFRDRTKLAEEKSKDITTWSLDKLHSTIAKLYKASLQNDGLLKATRLDGFDAIIIKGENTRQLRPTLYDFLTHRALTYFVTGETDLTRPSYQFTINESKAFAPAPEFVFVPFKTKDTASLQFKALLLFQDIIKFHLSDPDKDALIDVDLIRLNFVNQYGVMEHKEKLYEDALMNIETIYSANPMSAQASYLRAMIYQSRGNDYRPFSKPEPQYELKRAKELCETTENKFPKSEGGINCHNLLNEILSPALNVKTEKVNTITEAFRTLITYRNIKKLYLRIIKTSPGEIKKLNRNNGEDVYWSQLVGLKPLKSWNISLPDLQDFQEHSTEIKIDGLESGVYFILASIDNNFSLSKNIIARQLTYVSNISYLSNNNQEYYVLHRDNGQPLEGVNVQIWERTYNYNNRTYEDIKKEHYTTDKNGFFKLKASNDYRSFVMQFTTPTDELFMEDYNYYNNFNSIDQPIKPVSYLFTDRSIYRPGQIVYFKGIVVQGEKDAAKSKVVPGFTTKIILRDANYQKAGELQVTTNDFGSFNGSFKLPEGVMNGQFSLYDSVTNKEDYFSVEEYKRPKFFVDVQKPGGTYRLNDSVTVTGTAKAYAGNMIDGANVKYRIVRKIRYPIWWEWGWYRRGNWGKNEEMEITNGFAKTDAKGEFKITFKALPDESVNKKDQPRFYYEVNADVTDINGETRSGNTSVAVAYQMLQLNIDIPEKVSSDSLKKLKIVSTNLNDLFESTKVSVLINKVKSPGKIYRERYWDMPDQFMMSKDEYTGYFPYDLYKDEDVKNSWPLGDKVLEHTDSTKENGQWAMGGRQFETGWYKIVAVTKDTYGEEVKAEKFIQIQSGAEGVVKQVSGEPEGPLNLNVVNNKAEPGEKINYSISTGFDKIWLLHSLSKMNNRIKTNYLSLEKNKAAEFSESVQEADRGGMSMDYAFVKHNRVYSGGERFTIPWSNKELMINYSTFRDKLVPGSKEKWTVKISGSKGEKIAAEMVASMYDASLDQFKPHYWSGLNFWPSLYNTINWNRIGFELVSSEAFNRRQIDYQAAKNKSYDRLQFLNGYYGELEFGAIRQRGVFKSVVPSAPMMEGKMAAQNDMNPAADSNVARNVKIPSGGRDADGDGVDDEKDKEPNTPKGVKVDKDGIQIKNNMNTDDVQVRKNFNETAFFLPSLKTDAEGDISFEFTIPEALTKWKLMALAHSKDLASGYAEKTTVTQKSLMVQPNAPRFLREGDKMEFSAKIVNLEGAELTGTASLELIDASNNNSVDGWFKNVFPNQYFTVPAGKSVAVKFPMEVPFNFNSALTYRIVAKASAFSDGEEMALPVLTNRMLVTESMPLNVRHQTTKTFKFDKLLNSAAGTTLSNHAVTVEYTSNPAWYAVQALPYLMEYPYECAEQTFNRYYANALATYISNSMPKIKTVFEKWKQVDTAALLSNLQKNEELKSALLQETPWVLDAHNENQQKKNIALLFDMVKMSSEMNKAFNKLKEMQSSNGGFTWFKGGPDDRYMTQYIITGIGHLRKLNALSGDNYEKVKTVVDKAIPYLDMMLKKEYDDLLRYNTRLSDNHLSFTAIQYLYMRSFFNEYKINETNSIASVYFMGQAKKYWLPQSKYMQAMIALALHRDKDAITPAAIIKSLKENAISKEEMGMYWKEWASGGYWWHQAPIESQAIMIEAFGDIDKNEATVDDLKTWLLKQKQTQNWKTTKATAEACYALLLNGSNWLAEEKEVTINLGNTLIKSNDRSAEAGTGYFKKRIEGDKVKPEMGNITVNITKSSNQSSTSWGSVYWQYFEDLDKITPAETPLKLKKQLFIEKNSEKGPVLQAISDGAILKIGDKVKVRIELRVDRDMEYVHMKDMRAACMEPVNVLSEYKYQGGLGYYESTKDASTNFFFGWLSKGTYVFEYPMYVTHAGNFSNGITTIQCMYAPEFTSHSEGIRVTVE